MWRGSTGVRGATDGSQRCLWRHRRCSRIATCPFWKFPGNTFFSTLKFIQACGLKDLISESIYKCCKKTIFCLKISWTLFRPNSHISHFHWFLWAVYYRRWYLLKNPLPSCWCNPLKTCLSSDCKNFLGFSPLSDVRCQMLVKTGRRFMIASLFSATSQPTINTGLSKDWFRGISIINPCVYMCVRNWRQL